MKPAALSALLALLIASAAFGQTVVVPAGTTHTFTSGSAVSWSLSGPGSLSTTGPSTSTVYTAPTGLVAPNQMQGVPVEPLDTFFNLNLSGVTVDANSAAKITTFQHFGFLGLSIQSAWGMSYADASTPLTTFKNYFDSAALTMPYPTGSNQLQKEAGNRQFIFGWKVQGNTNQPDEHAMVIRHTDYSFWDVYDPYSVSTVSICADSTAGCNAQSSGTYSNWSGNPYLLITPDGTTAAGQPLAATLLHPDELKVTSAGHLLEFTVATAQFAAGLFLRPANATASGCSAGCTPAPTYGANGNSTNYPVMGSILRLKPGFTTTGVCGSDTASSSTSCSINNICSGMTTLQNSMCVHLLSADLQNHGMMIADIGTANAIICALECSGDLDFETVAARIKSFAISTSNFDVLDTVGSGIVQNSTTYQATANGSAGTSATIGGISYSGATQSTVTTSGSRATVTGGPTAYTVALMPISIGSSWPLTLQGVMSSSGPRTIPYWISPSTVSQALTVSVVGTGCGTIGGTSTAPTFTPPTTSALVTGCNLHLVSTFDSAATLDIYYSVLPSMSGALRVDSGAATTTMDGNGNTWQADTNPQYLPSSFGVNTGSHWPSGTYAAQYNTSIFTSDIGPSDIRYWFLVAPSTNYTLHILFGIPDGLCTYPCGTWPGPLHSWQTTTFSPYAIEVNGQPVANAFDPNYQSGYLYDQPIDITVPATSDAYGNLELSIQPLTPDVAYVGGGFTVTTNYTGANLTPPSSKKNTSVSAIELVPSAASPSLTVDAGLNTRLNLLVAPGGASQPFYAIPNYFTGGTTTWNASGAVCVTMGCTLASDNLSDGGMVLTLGSGSVIGGQPILITATNGSYSGSLTLYTGGSGYLVIF